jgi:cyclic AMP-dependent transcription factor ATF-4
METQTFTFMAPGALFEAPEHYLFEIQNESVDKNWMDIEMDLDSCSPSMSLFHELDDVEEVKEAETIATNTAMLSQLISQCGIPVEEEEETIAPLSPASSMDSDMEAHQSLIDELEDYFGSPTRVEEDDDNSRGLDLITKTSISSRASPNSILEALATGQVFNADQKAILTEMDLNDAVTTSCVTEDGQNVIIIIAPPSPAPSTTSSYDTDPEWVPSPSSSPLRTISSASTTIKKKYQRSKPPSPPTGPYPVEKKERKKAQNRTAAFRYREKKKGELDVVETELEQLTDKNEGLRSKLTEMETEARLLKKLMIEAGLGRYANTMTRI